MEKSLPLQALVIDDDPQIKRFIARILSSNGWVVEEADNAEQAFEKLQKKNWLLVFCDVVLGGPDGYAVLRRFSQQQPDAYFILMTGYGSAAGALDATAIGAYDYLVKPFSIDDIHNISKRICEQHQRRAKQKEAKGKSASSGTYKSDISLIGINSKFIDCLKLVGRVAPTDLPVLITGESGTGKEVIARAIHQRSNCANGPFIAVNCGAIPVELIESELFGHKKGSFTGADQERVGLWQAADGGTIFLDEVTETSPLFQIKLLRTLQESEIRRVGSNQIIRVDTRVIAATNREIEKEVEKGNFREDLMYRLNTVTVHLPALRERIEDIPLLAEHFAKRFQKPGTASIKFSRETIDILESYSWLGNIREFENAIRHAVSLSDSIIYPEHLPDKILNFRKNSPTQAGKTAQPAVPSKLKSDDNWLSFDEMAAKYVSEVLSHTEGNIQAASRILKIDRKTLTRILKRAEINP